MLPEGADEQEFLVALGNILRDQGPLRRPFGERLKMGPLGVAGPLYWEPDTQLDMDYHVRHWRCPSPGATVNCSRWCRGCTARCSTATGRCGRCT